MRQCRPAPRTGFPSWAHRRAVAGGRRRDWTRHVEGEYGRAGAAEERRLLLSGLEAQRRAETRRAGDGHRQHASLGQDAPEIVEIDGNEFNIGESLSKAKDAGAELGDLVAF